MARDLNDCKFIGRLGQDVEIKYLPSGSAVANISIAVSDDYKDKSGQKVEQTEWVRITAFGKLAEIMGQYLHKGSKIFISGRMKTRKWTDQQGVEKYSTEIVAENMQMLDGAQQANNATAPSANNFQSAGAKPSDGQPGLDDFPNDDIPW